MRLSALDQSICLQGHGQDAAIRDTLETAQLCDELGYHRFWLSEHHGNQTIVGTAPEILMAAIAGRTRRIRIGSAGVMLTHYSAFKVAEVFRVLESLAPGRIDLGVGRAPAGDMRTALALNPTALMAGDRFEEQVLDLKAWLTNGTHRGVVAHPLANGDDAGMDRVPDLWMLGVSERGAQLAARLGLPFAFGYFLLGGQGVDAALTAYRSLYVPNPRHARPHATICVWALAANTEAEARHHALSHERWFIDPSVGLHRPLQSANDVAREGFTEREWPAIEGMRRDALVGSARQVGNKLRALAQQLELDEIVINTCSHDPQVRRRSYQLLAQEFNLHQP